MPRNTFPSMSFQLLLSANFFAMVAAGVGGWRLNDLLTLYWLELIALGAVTIVQMRYAAASGSFQKSRGYLIVLFLAHYGTFSVIYRAAMLALFGAGAAPAEWFWLVVWLPLAALIIVHAVSLRRDYLPKEAAVHSPFDAMWIPYLRELPVHIPLLIALALLRPDPGSRAVVLTVAAAKLALDLAAHVLYHTRLARTSPST